MSYIRKGQERQFSVNFHGKQGELYGIIKTL